MGTKILEKVTLRGAVTLGQGTQAIQGDPAGKGQQGNMHSDLTLLLPLASCHSSPLAIPSKKSESRGIEGEGNESREQREGMRGRG